MGKILHIRIRSVERVSVSSAGILQDHICDTILIHKLPEADSFVVQMFDVFRGEEQKLKERPRLIGTIQFAGEATFNDDIVWNTFAMTGHNGLSIVIKPAMGMNLRVDYGVASDASQSMLQRKLRTMHLGITELERQIESITHPEARAKLEASLANLRNQTSNIERHLSGTQIIPGSGRGK